MSKSVCDKIRCGDYETKLLYPERPREAARIVTPTAKHGNAKLAAAFKAIEEDYEKKKALFKSELETYRKDVSRLEEEFVKDLAEEAGVAENPKANLLFSKAWDRGHASGRHEVYSVYMDLVELILP